MKTIARMIFIVSMVLAGLSVSAYGVALAAPGLHMSSLVRNFALVQSSETPTVTGTTETPDVTETPEASETPDVTESPEPTESPEVTDTPEPSETPDVTDSPEASDTPEATEAPDSQGTDGPDLNQNGDGGTGGGDTYQPLGTGWLAWLSAVSRTGL